MYDVVASLCKVAELPHPLETPVLKVWWKCKVCVCVSLLGMCLVCLKICCGVTAAGIKDVAAKRGLGGPVTQMSGMALELRKTAGHFVQSGLQEWTQSAWRCSKPLSLPAAATGTPLFRRCRAHT